jgi:phage terminase small subunit
MPEGGTTMTEKQKRFCDEYLVDYNATQAAVRAGYSAKSAYSIGEENLRKPELKTYIDERLEQLRSAKTATATEVMEFLTEVMRDEGEGSVSRLKAAELLGKRFGLFTDKLNVEGNIPVVIAGDDKIAD